MPIKMLIG